MNREWLVPAKILTGICALAVSSFSQTYTVSAKPGAVNFIEGDVTVNGEAVWTSNLKSTFLNANDVIAIKSGKAEVLLTPGVFLRLGDNSQVRMIKPSLVETQVEIISGESMFEVDDLVPGSSVSVLDRGSSTTLLKPGLYRFSELSIAALQGKAEVAMGDKKVTVKKNKEVQLGESLTQQKVDLSQGDDLYAWSNTRAQYNAAATYAGSTQAYQGGGYGYGAFSSPGWYWNSPFSSYMWMPGNGAFYSPFGWGFYGPGVVAYAPVVGLPYSGGGWHHGNHGGTTTTSAATGGASAGQTSAGTQRPTGLMAVPVDPRHAPVAGFQGRSPAAFDAARMQMQQRLGDAGMRTASGAPAADLRPNHTFSNAQAASHAAAASARSASSNGAGGGGGWAGRSSGSGGGGGWSGDGGPNRGGGGGGNRGGGGGAPAGAGGPVSHSVGGAGMGSGHGK